jgi:hypothetical protein
MTEGNEGNLYFVTGPSRSGTTLCNRVLGNHSQVLGLKELHYFGELYDVDAGRALIGNDDLVRAAAMLLARQARDSWVDGPTTEELNQARTLVARLSAEQRNGADLYATVVAHMASKAARSWACEQTPRNIFYAEKLLDLYPHARIIFMVRDPRAVLASQKNRWQMRRLGARNVPYTEVIRIWFNYHPVTMSSLWARATEAAIQLEQHPRFRLLRFEDLVGEPEQTVKDLCAWLKLEFEPGMLDVPQWGSSNVEHDSETHGVSAAMTDQWKKVLSEGEVRISEQRTAAFLSRFDYPLVTNGKMNASAWLQLLVRYPLHLVGAVLTNPRRVWIQLRAIMRRPVKAG